MSNFFSVKPKFYSSKYPPVDSSFTNNADNWPDLPDGTQILSRIMLGNEGISTPYIPGFIKRTVTLQVKLNGTDTGTVLSNTQDYSLPAESILYGYSVTPDYVNFWTDPSYIDKAADVMWGQRGLHFDPSNPVNPDLTLTNKSSSNEYINYWFLSAIGGNCLYLAKFSTSSTNEIVFGLRFSGNFADYEYNYVVTPKSALTATVISTQDLEIVVKELSDSVASLQTNVTALTAQVTRLDKKIMDIGSSTSKFFVSR